VQKSSNDVAKLEHDGLVLDAITCYGHQESDQCVTRSSWNRKKTAYVASVPALPGCVSQGDTRTEALNNIREAIELYVEDCRD
jgi:HicB_like antitoxin of bacterial toxin-antitoxin system